MSIFENDIHSFLRLRIAFAPSQGGSELTPRQAQALSDLYAASGYGLLQFNPELTVQWFHFNSYYSYNGSGFSQNLLDTMDRAGIEWDRHIDLTPYPRNLNRTAIGRLGENAVEAMYNDRGLTTWREYSGARRADVVGYKWSFFGGDMYRGESKVRYQSLTGTKPGEVIYQLTHDISALAKNNVLRGLGQGVMAVGAAVDVVMTGAQIRQQLSAGDNLGAARSGIQFGGRWGGAVAGAWGGASLGGTIGSVFPFFGTALSGPAEALSSVAYQAHWAAIGGRGGCSTQRLERIIRLAITDRRLQVRFTGALPPIPPPTPPNPSST